MAPSLKDFLIRAVVPAYLISLAIYQFTMTVIETIIVHHEPGLLLNLPKLRERAFSRFWIAYGESLSDDMPEPAVALLSTVSGTVLDLGPGSGEQLCHFNPSAITRIYGAEPAGKLHDKLRFKAKKCGLEDKYRVLHCGGEPESLIPALAKTGLLRDGPEDIFDEIVCVRVLCGVPKPQDTIEGLYRLLKPGGRLVMNEHVVNPRGKDGSLISRGLQTFYSWAGWDFFMNCKINRNTKQMLLKAGGKDGWSKVELQYVNAWSTIPHLVGYLVKKG